MVVTELGGTLLDRIVEFIIPTPIVLFLNQILYRNFFIIINYWSFVHLGFGMIFYFLKLKKFSIKQWFYVLLVGHIVFEFIEFILALGGNPLFVEEFIDIVWDIIWSLIGFGFTYLINIKINKDLRLLR